ncbi:MAG: DUF3102 domain-containing protein [Pirellulaceae bacterium]
MNDQFYDPNDVSGFLSDPSPEEVLRMEGEAIELMKQANECHNQFGLLTGQALETARKTGELLSSIKQLVPYGNFQDFLEKHFAGSLSTASAYMRVYNNWDNPMIVANRNHCNDDPMSLKQFLTILTEERKGKKGTYPPDEEMTAEMFEERNRAWTHAQRCRLRTQFSRMLATMNSVELNVLEEWFEDLCTQLEQRVEDLVCKTWECDYYADLLFLDGMGDDKLLGTETRVALTEMADKAESLKQLRSKGARNPERGRSGSNPGG